MRAVRRWAARHGAFLVVLALAVALRITVMIGYRPIMWFNDSYGYVADAFELNPSPIRPSGYSFLLKLLDPLGGFTLVAVVQHLMGLTVGVLCYQVVRRLGAPAWAAVLAAVPVLFDAYQVQLEHLVMSDTLFTVLVVGAVVLVVRARPTVAVGAVAGVLLGLATVTRSIGQPLLILLIGYLLIRQVGWRVVTTTALAGAIPIFAYMSWFHEVHGRYSLSDSSGIFLYSRTMAFADCGKIKPPPRLAPLCDDLPAERRPLSQLYIWSASSPLYRLGGEVFTEQTNRLAGEFARRAVLAQPLDYLSVVLKDVARTFAWERTPFPDEPTYAQYRFDKVIESLPNWEPPYLTAYDPGWRTVISEPQAGLLGGYQDRVYLRGSMFGVVLLVGLAGLFRRPVRGSPAWYLRWLRAPGLLPWLVAVVLVVVPAATAEFSYRYVLAAVPLAMIAAALAFRRSRAPS
ncbi:hypothetical protein [Rhizohabitans arisaemae]|uniref:hypothetical protein n=1 Tax=Rhizohabitans arisaemae TaxID=2720610 RepID=UPI0024B050C5|nr:hypothetical protein [Rhizohabitans arisaemae]